MCHRADEEVRGQPWVPVHQSSPPSLTKDLFIAFLQHVSDQLTCELLGSLPQISPQGHWDYRHLRYVSGFQVVSGILPQLFKYAWQILPSTSSSPQPVKVSNVFGELKEWFRKCLPHTREDLILESQHPHEVGRASMRCLPVAQCWGSTDGRTLEAS